MTDHVQNRCGFEEEPAATTLNRLYEHARHDWKSMLRFTPTFMRAMMSGKSVMKAVPPSTFRHVYMPVSRDEGRFLYMTARVIGARNVVEFGSSFGISTLHLASAMKDNGGGKVITTEIEPSKCRATEHNLREAGLDAFATVIEGDATKTLEDVEGPIDLLFLDGWKDLYLTVLQLLLPRLRKGAVVIADNVRFPDARPYVDYVRTPSNGFISMSMFKNSLEYSCWVG